MNLRLGDFLVYGIAVGGLLVLTKNPNGTNLVKALGNSGIGFAQAVTGQKVSG